MVSFLYGQICQINFFATRVFSVVELLRVPMCVYEMSAYIAQR